VAADAAGVTLRNVVDPVGAGGSCDGCTTTAVVPPIVGPAPAPDLPVTGGTVAWGIGAAALALVLVGLVLMVVRRRRAKG